MSTDSSTKQARFLMRYAVRSLGAIVLFAVLIRTFLVSSYVMSGTSMLPSVLPGDFLVGRKWKLNRVQRGDVVVLHCPNSRDRICMRRVVALEGDRVDFKGGRLIVNGQEAQTLTAADVLVTESIMGAEWRIWPGQDETLTVRPTIVPPQQVYLLNDKRAESEDSRRWGAVPLDLIEARLNWVWLSLDWSDGSSIRSWPRVRWERFLRTVD